MAYHFVEFSLPQYSIQTLTELLAEGRLTTTEKPVKRGRRRQVYPLIRDVGTVTEEELPGKVSIQFDYPPFLAASSLGISYSAIWRYGAMKIAVEKGNNDPLIINSLTVLEKELGLPPTRPPLVTEPGPSGNGSPSSQNAD